MPAVSAEALSLASPFASTIMPVSGNEAGFNQHPQIPSSLEVGILSTSRCSHHEMIPFRGRPLLSPRQRLDERANPITSPGTSSIPGVPVLGDAAERKNMTYSRECRLC